MKQDKIVTTSYINTILTKLHEWMPFKRRNGGVIQNDTNITTNENEIALGSYNMSDSNTILSIGIGDEVEKKNAIKICKDGEVFIITNPTTGNVESLQKVLDKKGVEICDEYIDMIKYMNESYIGKCLFLKSDSQYDDVLYEEGLYIVSYSSTGIKLVKISGSLKKELNNYYTNEEVNEILKNIIAGDFSDIYYSKDEINEMLSNISKSLEEVNDFIEKPIDVIDLEIITKRDLNNDNKIG
jgi:HEPN domain-containing protein